MEGGGRKKFPPFKRGAQKVLPLPKISLLGDFIPLFEYIVSHDPCHMHDHESFIFLSEY